MSSSLYRMHVLLWFVKVHSAAVMVIKAFVKRIAHRKVDIHGRLYENL